MRRMWTKFINSIVEYIFHFFTSFFIHFPLFVRHIFFSTFSQPHFFSIFHFFLFVTILSNILFSLCGTMFFALCTVIVSCVPIAVSAVVCFLISFPLADIDCAFHWVSPVCAPCGAAMCTTLRVGSTHFGPDADTSCIQVSPRPCFGEELLHTLAALFTLLCSGFPPASDAWHHPTLRATLRAVVSEKHPSLATAASLAAFGAKRSAPLPLRLDSLSGKTCINTAPNIWHVSVISALPAWTYVHFRLFKR